MSLEIFKGKKGVNNKLILQSLYEIGYLSGWKLARAIAEKDLKSKGKKTNWYHEALKKYSVLIRSGGRLEKLSNKEYIMKTDRGYCLTVYKGFCSALTLYKDVRAPAIDDLSRGYELFPELKEAMEIILRLHPDVAIKRYQVMRKATQELLKKGLNFDVIPNHQFNAFFNNQMEIDSLQELKKERETREKWNPSPELQEIVIKLVKRMKKDFLKQVEELDKELNSAIESIHKPLYQKRGDKS